MNNSESCIQSYFFTRELPNLDVLLRSLNGRYSSNPVDKVCSIAFPFQRRGSDTEVRMTFPIYDPGIPLLEAWDQFISIIASTFIDHMDIHKAPTWDDDLMRASHPPTIQLLRLFPHPSRHHWFPSWAQVQQYPDVSVRDNDPGHAVIPDTQSDSLPWYRSYARLRDHMKKRKGKKDPSPVMIGSTDHCLHIVCGRIYRSCCLQLTQSPTPEKRAIYSCSIGIQSAQLMATVPGIELPINSATKYVLVDISPDKSLWSACYISREKGHEHLPIWQESVVLVCEEVDTLPRPTTAKDSLKMKYYLRRITTLEWDCRISTHRGPGRWLPFQPSLVHRKSIVCSTWGPEFNDTLDPGMFCDLAAMWNLEGRFTEWVERTPDRFTEWMERPPDTPTEWMERPPDPFTEWMERTPMYSVYLV